jgi:type VI protein secretion system component Hcp
MRVTRTVVIVLCLVLAVPVFAASNRSDGGAATVKLDGFDSIAASSYSFGVSILISDGSSGGIGTGKVTLSDFTFTKKMDASSSKLFKACAAGTPIKNAIIVVRDEKGNTLNQLMLSPVIIRSVQTSSDGNGVTESISLAYTKIEFQF